MKSEFLAAFKRNVPVFITAVLGAVAGYLLYRFVGCSNGTCVIMSNPYTMILYCGAVGGLIGSVFTPDKRKACKEDINE